MKLILPIVLLFAICGHSREKAVSVSTKHFNNPQKSLSLDSLWRYQSGDNPEWAMPGFDDSRWRRGVSSVLYGKSIDRLGWKGAGWFRLHLKPDSSVKNKRLSFTILQSCASEVFLDGEKLFQEGLIGTGKEDQECKITWGSLNLFPVVFTDTNEHLLAVRYSYLDFKRSEKNLSPAGFMFHIGEFDATRAFLGQRLMEQSGYRWFFTGVPLAFALLHLLLVVFYPKSKANLYYALFTISAAGLTYNIMGSWLQTDIHAFYHNMLLFKISCLVLFISGLQFLYTSFYPKLPVQYWAFLSVTGLMLLISPYISVRTVYFLGFIFILEQIRIVSVALFRKKPGARIIFAGYTVCMLGCTYQMLMGLELCPVPSGIFQFPYLWGFMGMMISMSVYLASNIASTSRQLEKVSLEQKKTIFQLESEIAERKRTEDLNRRQQEKLVQTDKMASIGILVSGVGHEINNPNNYMLLNSNNLADVWKGLRPLLDKIQSEKGDFEITGIPYSEMREEIPKLIGGISEGSERIRKIVQNLRDFARKDPGNMDQSVDINKVTESAIVILANLIKNSTDRFSVDYAKDLRKIRGNSQQIEQVVINLISNACQALENKNRSLAVSTASFNNQVVLSVHDEGRGISDDQMKHLFDPFYTTKRESGGTGLGLSISYNIIKAHAGELTFNSEPGRGTEAVIKLPVEN